MSTKPVKRPHARQLVHDLMRRLECANVRDLSRLLGWDKYPDRERKLYKWEAGDQAPNMQSTIELLTAAGLLLDEPIAARPAAPPAQPAVPQDIAAAAAVLVAEIRSQILGLFADHEARLGHLEAAQAQVEPPPNHQRRANGE